MSALRFACWVECGGLESSRDSLPALKPKDTGDRTGNVSTRPTYVRRAGLQPKLRFGVGDAETVTAKCKDRPQRNSQLDSCNCTS